MSWRRIGLTDSQSVSQSENVVAGRTEAAASPIEAFCSMCGRGEARRHPVWDKLHTLRAAHSVVHMPQLQPPKQSRLHARVEKRGGKMCGREEVAGLAERTERGARGQLQGSRRSRGTASVGSLFYRGATAHLKTRTSTPVASHACAPDE